MFVIEKHGVHIYVRRNLAMERLRKKWKGQYEDSQCMWEVLFCVQNIVTNNLELSVQKNCEEL